MAITPAARDFRVQLGLVIDRLRNTAWHTLTRDNAKYIEALNKCIEWIHAFPRGERGLESDRQSLNEAVCESFGITPDELITLINRSAPTTQAAPITVRPTDVTNFAATREAELISLLPPDSFLSYYVEWTKRTEPPATFHAFCGLAALGAAASRKVYKPMGWGNIFGNFCVILVGPTGRVKKSTAANIAQYLVRKCNLLPIFPQRVTPEAMVNEMAVHGGQQFIYADELTSFINKASYNDTLLGMLLKMLDCPDTFDASTIMRGHEVIKDVALSFIGGSTPELLAENAPRIAVSGGFLNRFVVCCEEDTPRCYPDPEQGSRELEALITNKLLRVRDFAGEARFTHSGATYNDMWYRRYWQKLRDVETHVAATMERDHSHLIRIAMLLHLADHDNLNICENCMHLASQLLDFIDQTKPAMLSKLSNNVATIDAAFVLDQLRKAPFNGIADHSRLLKRCSHRLTAESFKRHVTTLIESGQVREETRGSIKHYVLRAPQ